jgi:hypothetical protein
LYSSNFPIRAVISAKAWNKKVVDWISVFVGIAKWILSGCLILDENEDKISYGMGCDLAEKREKGRCAYGKQAISVPWVIVSSGSGL